MAPANLFPPITPDRGLTITQPKHPHVAVRSSGGGESRIKLSNVRVGAKISLTFSYISTDDLQAFRAHWNDARGTARDFQISAVNLGAMATKGMATLLSTTWKYASPPSCTDLCAGAPDSLLHIVEIELISQPRRVAAYINPTAPELSLPVAPSSIRGGMVVVRSAITGGLISTSGGWQLAGQAISTGQVWLVAGKFSTGQLSPLPGVDLTATAAINAVGPTVSEGETVRNATAGIVGGVFTLFGDMPGGTIASTASIVGGQITIPARAIGGAGINATAALAQGHFGIVAPGGVLNSAAVLVGGQFSTTINGAALSAEASLEAGTYAPTIVLGTISTSATLTAGQYTPTINGGDLSATASIVGGNAFLQPAFASVALLVPGDGTNNSTNIIDLSNNALTITRSGSPVISTAASQYGGASVKINSATQDRLTVDSTVLNPGNTDFWCEAWMRWTGTSGANFQIYLAHEVNFDGDSNNRLSLSRNSITGQLTASIQLRVNTTFYGVTGSLANSLTTTFYHIAWGRVNGELAVWLNGVLSQTSLSGTSGKSIGTATVSTRGNKMFFGPRAVTTGWQNYPDVFIDDFRYVKATAPWGLNNFNPPTSAHPTS